MPSSFLLYGANGFVGDVIARLSVQQSLQPILAGRDAVKIESQAIELGVERRVFSLDDSAEERAKTLTHVWGEVEDDQGRSAVSRLHGPEAWVIWTARAALAAVQKVLAGNASPGFQTPALAYGADFVLEGEGVTREDLN